MTTVLYPGSFDPFHLGHLEVVEIAARQFDRVIVAAVNNPQKTTFLSTLEQRRRDIERSCAHLPTVEVADFSGLVVDLAQQVGATAIIKGLRGASDLDIEAQMALTNHSLTGVDTLFVVAGEGRGHIAASLIRDIYRLGGDVSHLVPTPVAERLYEDGGPPSRQP